MKAAPKKFIVDETFAGQRLDVFLSQKLEITRSQVQKMIESGLVTLRGQRPRKTGDTVKEGYVIEIQNLKRQTKKQKTEKTGERKAPKIAEPKILAATDNFIVVEKPWGMLSHPTMAGEKNTLVDFLKNKYPELKKVGDNPKIRPGIVHRLDKEASGLMVVARNRQMFDFLKKQFKERSVVKEYLALVHGRVSKDWDELKFPIGRSHNEDRMAARPLKELITEKEKEAHTEFIIEKRFVNFTLLRVTLHTGRMHQIRVHFLAYNHPLAGDPLYFQKKQKRKWDEKLGRLFLHSTKLSFKNLDGSGLTFESPLPPKLKHFLTELA